MKLAKLAALWALGLALVCAGWGGLSWDRGHEHGYEVARREARGEESEGGRFINELLEKHSPLDPRPRLFPESVLLGWSVAGAGALILLALGASSARGTRKP